MCRRQALAKRRHLRHRARVTKLEEIVAHKREEIEKILPLAVTMPLMLENPILRASLVK